MSISLTGINSYSNIIISRQEVKYVQEIFATRTTPDITC